jgi:cell wall-associated NlpC family hydrolase
MRKTVAAMAMAVSVATMIGASAPAFASSSSVALRANVLNETQLVKTALSYVGTPYTQTGTSPQTGFSSIGFVSYVYATEGVQLPYSYQLILKSAPRVKKANLQPGDLVFFKNTVWPGLSHVGIYIGNGQFVHAEYYGVGVRVSSFVNDSRDGNYWATHFKAANRPQGSS